MTLHLRSDLENIIDLLSMDRWLKSGSLKKTIKTSTTVPPVAMEASTSNRLLLISAGIIIPTMGYSWTSQCSESVIAIVQEAVAQLPRTSYSSESLEKNGPPQTQGSYRNSIKSETLDDFLIVSLNGPSVSEFDPTAVIDKWYFSAERQGYAKTDRAKIPRRICSGSSGFPTESLHLAKTDTFACRRRIKATCKEGGCSNYIIKGSFCAKHSVTKTTNTCKNEGCSKNAQGGGHCVKHGGTKAKRTCKKEDCPKNAQGGGYCVNHGGTKAKCKEKLCPKYAIRGGYCMRHGGTKAKSTCKESGCVKYSQGGGYCIRHGGTKAKRTCKQEGCLKNARVVGYCIRHGMTSRSIRQEEETCSKSFHVLFGGLVRVKNSGACLADRDVSLICSTLSLDVIVENFGDDVRISNFTTHCHIFIHADEVHIGYSRIRILKLFTLKRGTRSPFDQLQDSLPMLPLLFDVQGSEKVNLVQRVDNAASAHNLEVQISSATNSGCPSLFMVSAVLGLKGSVPLSVVPSGTWNALRGHHKTDSSSHPGIFRGLFNSSAELDDALKGHLEKATCLRQQQTTMKVMQPTKRTISRAMRAARAGSKASSRIPTNAG
uniref:WRKY19-like zinc finger domain-containing protein n=1 Tax=Timema douglasi TaxID=61478 RepID=A0A7R8VDW3_TIMDO|nr:unnamed protein product [Timema douglasi]